VRAAAGLVLLALTVFLAFLVDLGHPALWDPGEGRYAQTVREMLARGDWLVPTLNFAPYFDKPPGYYWMVAASFHTFGMTEWAARLPSAIPALLTIALTVGFAWRRLGPAVALGAGFVLATTAQFVALGRSVRMDMVLTCLVSGTLYHAYALWECERGRRSFTWPIYVLPALGLLVKGPIAVVLPVMIIGTLVLLTDERERLARLRPGPGAFVAAAIAVVCHLAVAVRSPEYIASFLWDQNVGRFVEAATGHSEPFWYFLWILPVTFLPWALFLPGTLRHAVRRARRGHDLDVFLLAWIGLTVVFFSLSSAKLATYVLPTFPPLALLVARYLARVLAAAPSTQRSALRIPTVVWSGGALVIALVTPFVVAGLFAGYGRRAAVTLALLPFAAGALWVMREGRWRLVPLLVVLGSLTTQAVFYRVGAPAVDEFASLRGAAEVARGLPDRTTIFAYKTRGHSFAFYDGRAITRLRSPSAAAEALSREQPVALLTKARYLEKIRGHLHDQACVWWQGASGRVLVTNLPPRIAGSTRILAPDGAQVTAGKPSRCHAEPARGE
jgi:4-amino-4-deoxy-L-arabinose transferase-like glycosyltransferase